MSKSESRPECEADLSEFQTAAEIANNGYEAPSWKPVAEDETDTGSSTTCRNCGNTVTDQFARVFGDNQNIVHGCPDCMTYRELKSGGGVE